MGRKTYVKELGIDKVSLWKDKLPLLGSLDIELTERCNNNCIHCYINLPKDDLGAMEKEFSKVEIKDILREAASLGCIIVRFSGGEPLLREDFEELYIFARKQGLKVSIFTNATLITPHLADLFYCIPPLGKMEVSVYGMKKSSYEAITRTPGSFEAAWRGINLLLEKKIPFIVKGAVLPSNKDEIDEFEAWAATIPWMPGPPSYSMFFNLRCRQDDTKKNEAIKKLRVSHKEGLKIFTRRRKVYIDEMRIFCSRFTRPMGDRLFSCGSGIRSGYINAYGGFQPCIYLRHPDMVYNLRKGSLKDALTNFFPGVREIKAVNPEYLVRCARCFLKGLCEQCPGKSWMEYGKLDTPVEYLCEFAHTQARDLGLLKEKEMAWTVEDWKERIKNFTGGDGYGIKS
ncbi:MAG: radical SAM protein [Candidatus Omnitrophota bacterium]